MEKTTVFRLLALLMVLIISTGIWNYFRIPVTKYRKSISTKDWVLPEEIEVTQYPSHGGFDSRTVDGALIPMKVFSPKDAVMALMYVRSYYGIDPETAGFSCTRDEVLTGAYAEGRRVFYFLQTYKGVPVDSGSLNGSRICVTVSAETGEVRELYCNKYQSRLDLDVTPEISVRKARKSIPLVNEKKIKKIEQVNLVIRYSRLCWRFSTIANCIYIDAKTGDFVGEEITAIPA